MPDQTSSSSGTETGFRFRDTTRAPFEATTRLRFDRHGEAVSAEIADISMEGMFVKTNEPRPVGTLVQFEFEADEGSVQGLGDVVWVRPDGGESKPAGMGIQFRYVDPQSREHVQEIVGRFVERLGGGRVAAPDPLVRPPEEPGPDDTDAGLSAMGTVAIPADALPGFDLEESDPGEDTADPGQPALRPAPPTPPTDAGPPPGAGVPKVPEELAAPLDADGSPADDQPPRTTEEFRPPSTSSFSLAVPRSEVSSTRRGGSPAEAGGAPSARRDDDTLAAELRGESSRAPALEPYRPPRTPGGVEIYGGGSSGGMGSRWPLLLGVIGALVLLGALVLQPWNQIGSAGTEDAPGGASAVDSGVGDEGGPEAGEQTAGAGDPANASAVTGAADEASEDSSSAGTPDRSGLLDELPPVPAAAGGGRLTAIDAVDGEVESLVRVVADRPLTARDFSTATVAGPPRFILRIDGIRSVYEPAPRSRRFSGIRSGIHQVDGGTQIHLVFDMVAEDFAAEAEVVDGALIVTFR